MRRISTPAPRLRAPTGPVAGTPMAAAPTPSRTRVALVNPEAVPDKRNNVDQRIGMMQTSVADANELFKTPTMTGDRKDKLFVAPEYYFDKETLSQGALNHHGRPPNTDRQLDQGDKRHIEGEMKNLSANFPDMTIMPGSMSWKKPVNRTENKEQYLARHNASAPDTAINQHYTAKYHAKHGEGANVPNNDLSNPNHRLHKADRKIVDANNLYNTNLPRPTGRETHIVHNSAPVFRGGEQIAEHQKLGDFSEIRTSNPGEQRLFVPGGRPAEFNMLDGARVSTEVCLDHNLGVTGNPNNPVLPGNIHVIESDYVAQTNNGPIRNNSAVQVHASTARTHPNNLTGLLENVHGVKVFDNPARQKLEVPPSLATDNVTLYEP